MARLTSEQVDSIVADDPTLPGDGRPSPRYFRHLYFCHFVLGEPWLDSFKLAPSQKDTPLSLETMRDVARDWDKTDEELAG